MFKALLGAVLVVVIAMFAKSRHYYLAGLAPLFPTFAIIAHYLVAKQQPIINLKATLLFSMGAMVPYFIYLLVMYYLVDKYTIEWSLVAATLAWLVSAIALILIWHH
nr:GlpM family protein [Spirabiliibacterium mucosae]